MRCINYELTHDIYNIIKMILNQSINVAKFFCLTFLQKNAKTRIGFFLGKNQNIKPNRLIPVDPAGGCCYLVRA